MNRRLEDRIRELCAQAVVSQDEAEQRQIFTRLRAALHEQINRLRLQLLLGYPPQRRSLPMENSEAIPSMSNKERS